MKKIILLCLVLLLVGAFELLANPGSDTLYKKANEAFEKAYYQKAYDLYQQAREGFLKKSQPKMADNCRIRMYQTERILLEYPYTKKETVKLLKENFKEVSKKERDAWLKDGKADFRMIDGQPRYFHGVVQNLMFRNPELLRKNPEVVERELGIFKKYHGMIFRSPDEEYPPDPWKPYINPITFLGIGTLSLPREKLPETGLLRLWIPLPIQTGPQDNIRVISMIPEKYVRTVPRTDGNLGSVYLEIPLEELKEDLQFSLEFLFRHYEQQFTVNHENVGEYDRESTLYQEYTRSQGNITINDDIRAKAKEIVGTEKNPYLAAKKIYDYVVENVWYSLMPHLTLNVLGLPESVYVHENGYGDCGAQSAYFVALCRAVGIPARDTGGWQLCPGHTGGHFWAEFYLPNYGWVPADTSIAQTAWYTGKVSEADTRVFREFYFANQDPYRFVIQKDVDIPLSPDPGEPVFLPMALQSPAVVCTTSEKDLSQLIDENWKMEFKPVNK